MIITIDGPSASGKSTLAKKLSSKLGINIMHTGMIYRAMAKKIMAEFSDINDTMQISNIDAVKYTKDISFQDIDDVTLKEEKYATIASVIAKIPEIRELSNKLQKSFASQFLDIVIEGRDSGTVVFPDADFKFYITVNLEIRAKRRFNELQQYDNSAIYEDILSDMKARDKQDAEREIAPLKPAEDAIIIDNSIRNIEDVVSEILTYIH